MNSKPKCPCSLLLLERKTLGIMNVFKTSDILFYIWPQRTRDRLISTCRMVLLMFATLGMKLNLGPETNMSATGHVCSAWCSHSDTLGLIGCLELNWAQTEAYNWTKSLWKWTDNFFSGFTLSFHFSCVLRLNADAFRVKLCLILSGRLADRVHVGYYCGNSCSEWRIFPSLTYLRLRLDLFFPDTTVCVCLHSVWKNLNAARPKSGINWAVSASLCSINQRRGCSRLLQIILIKGVVPHYWAGHISHAEK